MAALPPLPGKFFQQNCKARDRPQRLRHDWSCALPESFTAKPSSSVFKLLHYKITPLLNSLPFSAFDQFANFAFHEIAFQGADVADVEFAVQVVGFVQESAGQEIFTRLFENFSTNILSADGDFVGTADVLAKVRNAETTLALAMPAFGMNDFGIDEDEFCVGVFFEGDVDDGNAAADADLRGGEADAVGYVHGLEHVFDELLQFLVEDGYFLGGFLENRVAELY